MNTTTTDEAEPELTEFEAISVKQVSGVAQGANGFTHLMMKGVPESVSHPGTVKGARNCKGCGKNYDADTKLANCEKCGDKLPAADAAKGAVTAVDLAVKAVTRGKVDEAPDIDMGRQIMVLLGKAISAEADEIAAGSFGEVQDVSLLSQAANLIDCWLQGEQSEASVLATAKGLLDGLGKSTPELDAAMAGIAADLTARLAAKPADTAAAVVAKEGAPVDTVGDEALTKSVADAVTKALAPVEERVRALTDELAKVKATPTPGGPVLSVTQPAKAAGADDMAAKAARYRNLADTVQDQQLADGYLQLAREYDDKAKQG